MGNSLFVDVEFRTNCHGTYGFFKGSRLVEVFEKEYIEKFVEYTLGIIKHEDFPSVDFVNFDDRGVCTTISRVIRKDAKHMDIIDFTCGVTSTDHGVEINKRNIRKFVNASVASFRDLEQ